LAENPSAKILLIDANTRRPGLSLYFGLPSGGGLPQILNGAPAGEFLHPVERGNLHVLPVAMDEAGSHRLPQSALRQFLGDVGPHYDYVIFDAPPILESPETLVLGGVVDTSLVVVRAGTTKGGVVGRAMDTLAKAGVPALGVVLNRRRFDIPEAIYRRI
jgi:Mrp family chromosome partitioning ATPase